MLRIVFLSSLICISVAAYAQETIIEKGKYSPWITEEYHVLKNATNIKHGTYRAFYNKKTVIAAGIYVQGKKAGMWHFYNSSGKVVQHYNFDTQQPLLLVNNELPPNLIQYEFLPKPADTDSLTLPVKIGGVLYGYLPYINKFKVKNNKEYVEGSLYGILEILVSPAGRLAECKLLVRAKVWKNNQWLPDIIDSYILNPELLSEDEKMFAPGTVNKQKVPSTIYIYCTIKSNGRIAIY
ncbi:MAG: hypothetical protein ABIN91_10665 [Mucilaginibacter sp.]|uniref:hypothetical protein n=1 Tax=Mucilaginibacter sp. TaxID=1882438 RepID=UPI0032641835